MSRESWEQITSMCIVGRADGFASITSGRITITCPGAGAHTLASTPTLMTTTSPGTGVPPTPWAMEGDRPHYVPQDRGTLIIEQVTARIPSASPGTGAPLTSCRGWR